MSALTKQDLHRALKQGDLKPLYLLFGEETYLRDLAARAIADASLKESALREFNEESFSLTNTDVQQAIANYSPAGPARSAAPLIAGAKAVDDLIQQVRGSGVSAPVKAQLETELDTKRHLIHLRAALVWRRRKEKGLHKKRRPNRVHRSPTRGRRNKLFVPRRDLIGPAECWKLGQALDR